MLSVANLRSRFVAKTIRKNRLRRWLAAFGTSRHLVAVAHGKRTACKGAQQKELGHDFSQTPANYRPRRKPLLSGAAAPRHRRIPAHDRAAVRRPREIDPRARGGHEERRADPAGDAEERVRR